YKIQCNAKNISHTFRYNIVFFVVTYVIPMITLCITYAWMSSVLWKSESIGEVTELQKNSVKAKKNVVKMLVTVVILFAICWLPYHVYFLYVYHFPSTVHQEYIQHIYLAFYWFAMSNSVYNPIIYYIMNDSLQQSTIIRLKIFFFV
ncbi:tachykinin-like peptides receptor 86C, partial [Leptotrombidium deliense]